MNENTIDNKTQNTTNKEKNILSALKSEAAYFLGVGTLAAMFYTGYKAGEFNTKRDIENYSKNPPAHISKINMYYEDINNDGTLEAIAKYKGKTIQLVETKEGIKALPYEQKIVTEIKYK